MVIHVLIADNTHSRGTAVVPAWKVRYCHVMMISEWQNPVNQIVKLSSDFTGNRGGVYYEAGFAHGLGLPVIFMCRDGDELHFDVRQYNCIFWKPDQLLKARKEPESSFGACST